LGRGRKEGIRRREVRKVFFGGVVRERRSATLLTGNAGEIERNAKKGEKKKRPEKRGRDQKHRKKKKQCLRKRDNGEGGRPSKITPRKRGQQKQMDFVRRKKRKKSREPKGLYERQKEEHAKQGRPRVKGEKK